MKNGCYVYIFNFTSFFLLGEETGALSSWDRDRLVEAMYINSKVLTGSLDLILDNNAIFLVVFKDILKDLVTIVMFEAHYLHV